MSHSATIVLLAKELSDNWIRNYTLSGRIAFLENEKKKQQILAQAEELGLRDDVMELANKMMNGEANA